MPAGLSDSDSQPRHTPSRWAVRDAVVVIAGFAAGGALCGVVWEWWWTPPSGVVVDHTWYADLDGVRGVFSGTALYTVVALAGGLLLGAAAAWIFDRVELVTLLAVVLGSVVAAWVMYRTGVALAPPDPQLAAATAADSTELRGTLEVSGDSPFFSFPAGALAAVAAVFVGLAPGGRRRATRASSISR